MVQGGKAPAPGAGTTAAALLALLLLAAPGGAAGQQADSVRIDTPYDWIPHSLRVGAVGGYLDASLSNLRLGPQESAFFGLRGRARVSGPLSLELGALYGESDRFAVDPRLQGGPAPVDTLTSRWILAEAAVQFAFTGNRTWNNLHPYLILGGGFLLGIDEEDSPAFAAPALSDLRHDIEIMPSVQGGLGVEWLPSDRFGIAVEGRDHLWRVSTPDGFFDSAILERIEDARAEAPEETDWVNNLGISVTVYRYF